MAGNRPRWEKGQAVFHKKEDSRYEIENAYGSLRYIKEDAGRPQRRKGFAIEAKEAPGTLEHAENEKHLNPDKAKKVSMKDERFLYAAGAPFKKQAVFYDVSEYERSRDFLACMKRLITERHHQNLKNTFGFLEQDFDRQWKQELMQERKKELSLQEFTVFNQQIDSLNDRILKKEAKEQQLCADLQLMLDREKEKERRKGAEEHRDWKAPAFAPEPDRKAEKPETAEEPGTAEETGGEEEKRKEKRKEKQLNGEKTGNSRKSRQKM